MINKHPYSRGFTLIELLISMVIALVAIAAAGAMYVETHQTYHIQGMQSRLAEDGRFAMSMLQRMVFQAGFRANPRDDITSLPLRLAPIDATRFAIKYTADGINTVNCNGSGVANPAGTQMMLIIGRASLVPPYALQCLDASPGGVTLPAIAGVAWAQLPDAWIAPSATGNGTEVMDFVLEYGTDMATVADTGVINEAAVVTNPSEQLTPSAYGCGATSLASTDFNVRDCVADTYSLAIAQANPDNIVTVRVCLVLRTQETDNSVAKAADYPNCANVGIPNSAADRHLYRTFRSTIQVKNR